MGQESPAGVLGNGDARQRPLVGRTVFTTIEAKGASSGAFCFRSRPMHRRNCQVVQLRVPLRGLCRAAPSVEPARPAPTTAMPRSAVPSPKVTTKMSNFGSLVDAGALLR